MPIPSDCRLRHRTVSWGRSNHNRYSDTRASGVFFSGLHALRVLRSFQVRKMARYTTSRIAVGLAAAFALSACGRTPKPGLDRGAQLFDTCVPCHGADGGGNEALGAPSIAGLSQWYLEAQLRNFQKGVRGAQAEDPEGLRMRPMAKTLELEGDVESVAEYVASLPRPVPPSTLAGDVEKGRARFQICAACHGAGGEGNEMLKAPSLVRANDWYVARQLHKFKAGLRGIDPSDIGGATMRPNALMLDDDAMLNVATYIGTLR